MKTITYNGPQASVNVQGVDVKRGESGQFADATADSLIASGEWSEVKPEKPKKPNNSAPKGDEE